MHCVLHNNVSLVLSFFLWKNFKSKKSSFSSVNPITCSQSVIGEALKSGVGLLAYMDRLHCDMEMTIL